MIGSQDISVITATSYGLDGQGSISGGGKIFLFTVLSRPALGPTQPPILRVLSLEDKAAGGV
jgi:hypothetical protein